MIDHTQTLIYAGFPLVGGGAVGFGVVFVEKAHQAHLHNAWSSCAVTGLSGIS
jgi:hypothetical protein